MQLSTGRLTRAAWGAYPLPPIALGRSASAPSLAQPHRAFLCGSSSPAHHAIS